MLCVPGFKFSSVLEQYKRIITFKLLWLAFAKCISFHRINFTLGRKFNQQLYSLILLCKCLSDCVWRILSLLLFQWQRNQNKRWSSSHWHWSQPLHLGLASIKYFASCECGQFERLFMGGNWSILGRGRCLLVGVEETGTAVVSSHL